MPGAGRGYPPNRNRPITQAGEIGRIVRDLQREVELPAIDANFIMLSSTTVNAGTGGSVFLSVGPTSVDVGEQVSIDCGVVLTDALSSFVTLCCQNVADGAVFQALQSMARVAGKITYNWTVVGGNLIVNVYNDSEIDTNAMVWYLMV